MDTQQSQTGSDYEKNQAAETAQGSDLKDLPASSSPNFNQVNGSEPGEPADETAAGGLSPTNTGQPEVAEAMDQHGEGYQRQTA